MTAPIAIPAKTSSSLTLLVRCADAAPERWAEWGGHLKKLAKAQLGSIIATDEDPPQCGWRSMRRFSRLTNNDGLAGF